LTGSSLNRLGAAIEPGVEAGRAGITEAFLLQRGVAGCCFRISAEWLINPAVGRWRQPPEGRSSP
jgi:hypothetical protein